MPRQLRLPSLPSRLQSPKLRAPSLRRPQLRAPKLRAPSLRRPQLRALNLRAPKLRGPNLRGGANLRAPKLRGAKLRAPKLGSLNLRSISVPAPSLRNVQLGRRGGADVIGLDIQPGFVVAAKVRVNGSIVAERAAALPLGGDIVRDGEVLDADSLSETLRELFAGSGLGKHVRVGVANQRTVLRTLELPPLTDAKELAAAVTFQAQDQVPMPLGNAVLDFHPLGIVDTPQGPRQRVVLVAAQRDMVERLLTAVRGAGLTPIGVDLSAFALIRSLYRPTAEEGSRVLYLNIDGLTNLAIAEGKTCRFTRVVGGGLESIASELAVRRGIALAEARALLASVDLDAAERAASAAEPEPVAPAPAPEQPVEPDQSVAQPVDPDSSPLSPEEHAAREFSMTYEELSAMPDEPAPAPAAAPHGGDREVVDALATGIREIAGEVRNSLDFHRSQEGGGEVSHIVLSGAAQDIPGFAGALQRALGVEIHGESVATAAQGDVEVSAHRLAVATGLATLETPQ